MCARQRFLAMGRLVPFSLTLVHYEENDALGWMLSLVTLSPVFIMVSYVTLLVALRFPPRLVLVLCGQLACVALNLVLKRLLRQPRPEGPQVLHLGQHGMPSNHAMFMGYAGCFVVCAAARGGRAWQVGGSDPLGSPRLVAAALVTLSLLVAFSRFYLGYHTAEQVYVGLAVGALFGAFWHELCLLLLRTPALRGLLAPGKTN